MSDRSIFITILLAIVALIFTFQISVIYENEKANNKRITAIEQTLSSGDIITTKDIERLKRLSEAFK